VGPTTAASVYRYRTHAEANVAADRWTVEAMVKLAMELRDPRRKVGCFRAVICSFSAENNEISDISRCRAGVSFRGRTLPGTLISHIKTRKSDVAI